MADPQQACVHVDIYSLKKWRRMKMLLTVFVPYKLHVRLKILHKDTDRAVCTKKGVSRVMQREEGFPACWVDCQKAAWVFFVTSNRDWTGCSEVTAIIHAAFTPVRVSTKNNLSKNQYCLIEMVFCCVVKYQEFTVACIYFWRSSKCHFY